MFESQFTNATIEKDIESSYHDRRMYAKGILMNWGLEIGDLPFSR